MKERKQYNGQTKIKRCACVHAYQDRKYGLQRRVMNIGGKKTDFTTYKCTVCGDTQF
jgi:hypothetical protein